MNYRFHTIGTADVIIPNILLIFRGYVGLLLYAASASTHRKINTQYFNYFTFLQSTSNN